MTDRAAAITLSTILVTWAAAGCTQEPAAPPTPDPESLAVGNTQMRRSKLDEFARDYHAFGTYLNLSTRQFVIAVPADVNIPAGVAESLAGKARIERLDLTHDVADKIRSSVSERNFHPDAKQYTYASWVDLRSGRVIVVSDAPRDVLQPLLREFGGRIELRASDRIEDMQKG